MAYRAFPWIVLAAVALREAEAMRFIESALEEFKTNSTTGEDRLDPCTAGKNIEDQYCPDNPKCEGVTKIQFPKFGDTTQILDYATVTDMLAQFPNKQRNLEVVRGNNLGFCTLYENLYKIPKGDQRIQQADPKKYPYRTIFLGSEPSIHAAVRPVLDSVLAPRDGNWKYETDILPVVQKFLREQNHFDSSKGKEIPVLVTKILHKIHLNMDIDDEWAEKFIAIQQKFLMRAVLGGMAKGIVATLMNGRKEKHDVNDRVQYVSDYMDAIKANAGPGKLFDEEFVNMPKVEGNRLYNVAHAFFDSLVFAGGLSVVQGIQVSLNFLFSTQPIEPFVVGDGVKYNTLAREDIEAFIYEQYRVFPQVWGFGWWSPKGPKGEEFNGMLGTDGRKHTYTQQTLLNIATALRDPAAWGGVASSHTFMLRKPLADWKEKYGVAWVMQGNEDGNGPDDLGPMSRGCPGKELSVQITKAFLDEFLFGESKWVVGKLNKMEEKHRAGGITWKDTAPFHKKTAHFVKVITHGPVDVQKANGPVEHLQDVYFEYLPEGKGVTFYAFDTPRVSDNDPQKTRARYWDVSRVTKKYMYRLNKKDPNSFCVSVTMVVPWGPFTGNKLAGSYKFCVPEGAYPEGQAAIRDRWYAEIHSNIGGRVSD